MRRAVLAAGLAAAAIASGCQSAPLYRPAAAPGATGYFDQPISERRVQVTFRGTAVTPRETVESALLVRAAEVTQQRGFTHFVFDTRDTAADLRIRSDFSPWPGWGWPGYGWYYHGWGPGWGAGLRTKADTIYEAYAEIVLIGAAEARAEPRAIPAADVLARLGPRFRGF